MNLKLSNEVNPNPVEATKRHIADTLWFLRDCDGVSESQYIDCMALLDDKDFNNLSIVMLNHIIGHPVF